MLDKLHGKADRVTAFGFGKLFNLLIFVGLAMFVSIITPASANAWLMSLGAVAVCGLFVYAQGLSASVVMAQIQDYESTRKRLCEEVTSLGSEPPPPPSN